jgi:hypothetical protein
MRTELQMAKLMGIDNLEDVGLDERMSLKFILKKQVVGMLTRIK